MAENNDEELEQLKKIFSEDFDKTLDNFKKSAKILDKDNLSEIIKSIESRKNKMYSAFKELAKSKIEHGNEVPLVMAYAMATNAAHDAISSIVAGMVSGLPVPMMIGMMQASLYHKFLAPYTMCMWEHLQDELIDEELKATK